MDLGVLITASTGVITTFCSGFFTWIFSRKKYNAEVDTTTIDNLKATMDIYQEIVKDLGKKLDIYGRIIDRNRGELIKIKNVMIKMIGKICTIETCKNRCPYSEHEMEDLLKILDFDFDETDLKEN